MNVKITLHGNLTVWYPGRDSNTDIHVYKIPAYHIIIPFIVMSMH